MVQTDHVDAETAQALRDARGVSSVGEIAGKGEIYAEKTDAAVVFRIGEEVCTDPKKVALARTNIRSAGVSGWFKKLKSTGPTRRSWLISKGK